MTTLRQAAEIALQALEEEAETYHRIPAHVTGAIEALRQALAQTANDFVPDWDTLQPYIDRIAELEQEHGFDRTASHMAGEYVDTAPPKREWQNLTEEEMREIVGPWGKTPIKGYTRALFNNIEAKLKEKNND